MFFHPFLLSKPAEPGGGQGVFPRPDLAVNPIKSRGEDYAHDIKSCPPPPRIFKPSAASEYDYLLLYHTGLELFFKSSFILQQKYYCRTGQMVTQLFRSDLLLKVGATI